MLETEDVHVAAILGESPDTVLVGHHDGVVASIDYGETWTEVLSGMDVMAFAPTADGSLLAAGHGFIGERGDGDELMPLSAEPPDLTH